MRSLSRIRKRLKELELILAEQDSQSDRECIEGVIAEVKWILGEID